VTRSAISERLRFVRFFLIVTLIAAFSAASPAQESDGNAKPATALKPDSDIVAEIFLARDDGSGKAGDAATEFRVTDIPIYCIVSLNSNEPVTVKMNLVAVDVRGVKPETKVVTTTYTTKDRQNRVNFTGRPDGNWVAGKYRADIFVKDKLVWSKGFIIGTPVVKPTVKPVVARRQRA